MLTEAGGQCVEYTNSGDLCNLDYDTHLDNGRIEVVIDRLGDNLDGCKSICLLYVHS